MEHLSQDSQFFGQDLNLRPEYKAGVLPTLPEHLVRGDGVVVFT